MTKVADSPPAVKMQVRALVLDPVSNMPVVVLESRENNAFLPIWIGVCEANAIALVLEGVVPPRPMTHDLIPALLGATGYSVDRVHIHTLADSVFLASIRLINRSGETEEDAIRLILEKLRPEDLGEYEM